MNSMEYDGVAFMAGLVLDRTFDEGIPFPNPPYDDEDTLKADMKVMSGIVDRLHKHSLVIGQSMSSLRERHKTLDHPLEKQFSLYENMLCALEMRKHMALWKHAMQHHYVLAEQWEAFGLTPPPANTDFPT